MEYVYVSFALTTTNCGRHIIERLCSLEGGSSRIFAVGKRVQDALGVAVAQLCGAQVYTQINIEENPATREGLGQTDGLPLEHNKDLKRGHVMLLAPLYNIDTGYWTYHT